MPIPVKVDIAAHQRVIIPQSPLTTPTGMEGAAYAFPGTWRHVAK